MVHCRMGGEWVSPERVISSAMPGFVQEKNLGISETIGKEFCVASLSDVAVKTVEDYCETLSTRRGVDKDKLLRVKDFLTNEDTLKKVVSIYGDLLSEENQITTEKQAFLNGHLSFVMKRAFDQHLDNPEGYVSHGFDHSLKVVEYVDQIISEVPEVVQKVTDDYDITEPEAIFLLRNVALFHDFGYPESELRRAEKTMHSVMGADIVSNGEVEVNEKKFLVKEVLVKLLKTDRGGIMVRDFRDSILMHNADKISQFYDGKLETAKGFFLFKKDDLVSAYSKVEELGYKISGVSICVDSPDAAKKVRMWALSNLMKGRDIIDVPQIEVKETKERYKGRGLGPKNGKSVLGLEFSSVTLVDNPLRTIIRLADNMDITFDRLSPTQRNLLFRIFDRELGDENSSFFNENQEVEKEFKKIAEGKSSNDFKNLIAAYISAREVYKLEDDIIRSGTPEKMAKIVTSDKLKKFFQIQMEKLKGFDADECMVFWRNFIFDEITSRPGVPLIDEDTKMEVKKVAAKLDSLQFRHFGGYEPVESVQLSKRGIEIKVDQSIYDELNKTRVKDEIKSASGQISYIEVGVGEYQIRRMMEAFKSIKIRDGNMGNAGLSIYVNGKLYLAD